MSTDGDPGLDRHGMTTDRTGARRGGALERAGLQQIDAS
jgi:hypothetical protein